jgi:CRISPR-associated protein Cas2
MAITNPEKIPEQFARFMEWFTRNTSKTPDEMYCFIMYDIEHNKVRRLVAKYLEKQGCIRVQKSVFFARMTRKMHREVLDILRKAQSCYDNQDTIMVLPVGEDMLNALTCIGKNFELELMTAPKHTLIF